VVAGSDRAGLLREDFVWAETDRFRRRVDTAIAAIRRAADVGPIGVSFSGGKDSTVVLHLVRSVVPDAPAAFFDSGCELQSTLDVVHDLNVDTIRPRMSMLDMARYAGWWDYADPVDPGCPFDAKRVVIQEPSEAFVVQRRLRVLAHGVRAEESGARRKHALSRGELYQGADRTWYCMPIARWELGDVWAYIASRELRYNSAYDRMAEARIPRESQRVATLLGERGSGWGRHALLQRSEPIRFRELAREFPGLYRLT
jgi:3'-phosphoadenosine 5'-phosphosulfate sulfotransferase (PAPS reductase)/FAD synthetase